ncbi:MAG: hypothetical protein JRH10_14045 [Deltaproteobacteria bacterium]|nr:hypothetical protein [Deltaproteobacteria bacterium]MBW2447647.1 hypothetical protein [Deltaproteobacteria bacterium]
MVSRAVICFLILAFVWIVGIPARVDMDEHSDPDRYADAMGVPEVFDSPAPGRNHDVDPAPHRTAIERVERVLYRRGPATFGDAAAVESACARLADELLEQEGLRGRQAGLLLMTFAGRVGARADSGYTLPSLVATRTEWEKVRAAVFRPAAWLRTAGADLDRIQEPPPPLPDPRADAVLTEAEAELRRLLLRGQREAERLGEPRYDPDRPAASDRAQIAAWHRFGERWRRQLGDAMAPVERLAPRPHPSREPLRAEALRSLEEAREMLRRIPDGAGMWPTPFRPAWEARFRAASSALARTREQLTQAGVPSTPSRDQARWDR